MIELRWKDYGVSSLTLLAAHCGIVKDDPGIPHDPSDFRRCVHLFKCMELNDKEIKDLLTKTTLIYPIWAIISVHWDKLMDLYNEEKQQDSAPKLYKALQELIRQNPF
ncbi:hypothetical protein ACFL43_00390 [Thermodesulfobacteriota bacterium]